MTQLYRQRNLCLAAAASILFNSLQRKLPKNASLKFFPFSKKNSHSGYLFFALYYGYSSSLSTDSPSSQNFFRRGGVRRQAILKLLAAIWKHRLPPKISVVCLCLSCYPLLVSLRNRTGEKRRRQTLCDKRDNNFLWNNFSANFTFL